MKDEETILRVAGCRSDFEIATILGIEVDGIKGISRLDAESLDPTSKNADAKAARADMITAIRGGKHAELQVNAITFRQRPTPNRRFLRLAADKLADRAGSWKGLPFLTDHNTYSMSAAKGTILSSKLVEESAKVAALEQVLHVVKPDAVIGFLDGTYRKFSIGWFGLGPVMCSVHGTDVRAPDGCSCWPGDAVMLDGKPKIVEYEFSDYEGKEVSAVVVPAVRDTNVSDIRAALAAELSLPTTRIRKERTPMALMKLAAALALTALTESEEDRAVTVVTGMRERTAAAELEAGTLRTENTRLTTELAVQVALAKAAGGIALDGMLTAAYAAGKLTHGKDGEGKNTPDEMESLLRDFGSAHGADKLAAKLAKMPARLPLGQPPIVNATTEPASTRQLAVVPSDAQIAQTAADLGVSVDAIRTRLGLSPIAAGGAS